MTVTVPKHSARQPTFRVEGGALVLSMGRASIVLHEDGRIELMGTQLIQQLSGNVILSADRVDIMTGKSCKISP